MGIINHKKLVRGCIGNTGKFSPCFQPILVLTDLYVKNVKNSYGGDFHTRKFTHVPDPYAGPVYKR